MGIDYLDLISISFVKIIVIMDMITTLNHIARRIIKTVITL
jgi:hypothetical protein